MVIPRGLAAQRSLGVEWVDWLDRLPRLFAEVTTEWELEPDGEPWHGFCALAAPVRTSTGTQAVLKIAVPDEESEHEHLALQAWQGHGAVRLLRADPSRRAMLLERLERTDLSDNWDEEACRAVATLYGDLHVRPLPQLRSQASYVERWLAALALDAAAVPVPRRMVDQAIALGRDLITEPATAVLHGDLHYENVLRGTRDGQACWLAIDPKPTNGDPHYELEPMLRNRFEEYGVGSSVRDGIRHRFHTLVDTAGFSEERARDWVIVRSILNAHWSHEDAVRADREMTAAERTHVTRCIVLAKAVQE